jgi:hypothetical protein
MSKVTEKIREEIRELIPPTVFFFIALHLVALVRSLMVKGTGIPISSSLQVTIAALLLGKSVLIADLLPIMNRFPEKPLAYNVAWKTTIYLVIAAVLHYLENLIEFWRKAGSFVEGNKKLLAEVIWPHFLAIQIVLAVMILMYVTMRELGRVLGAGTIKKMFFGPIQKSTPVGVSRPD